MERRCFICLLAALGLLVAESLTSLAAGPRHGITEITLERTPCFGTCPVDRVTLRADGSASYTGTRYVDRLGEYKGTIGREEFDRLAAFLVSQKFFTLSDRYAVPATDLPS